MAAKRRRAELVAARKAAGYTQEGLAAALYVDRATVVHWEAGRHVPQPYLWPKLARLLGVTKERLQELLADVTITQSTQSGRMSYVLEHPSSVDLVAVAYLHERIRQLDEEYDRAPSTALLGPAAQAHGQVRTRASAVATGAVGAGHQRPPARPHGCELVQGRRDEHP
jgi:DNA-binding XRE family transcriptional regulator